MFSFHNEKSILFAYTMLLLKILFFFKYKVNSGLIIKRVERRVVMV